MSRSAAGTYSLPAGNPVVSGTTIDASWANTTMSDLGTEITDSLSRSGKGAMLAALELVAGSIGTPAISFDDETTLGFYRSAANTLDFVQGAARKFRINDVGVYANPTSGNALFGVVSADGVATSRLISGDSTADEGAVESEITTDVWTVRVISDALADGQTIFSIDLADDQPFTFTRPVDFDGATTWADASTARTNLGLAIGSDVQAYNANLAGLAAYTPAAFRVPMFSDGSGNMSTVITYKDEDDMASDSNVAVASQQSIKAYVDSNQGWNYGSSTDLTNGGADDQTSVTIADDVDFSTAMEIEIIIDGASQDAATNAIMVQIGPTGGVITSGYFVTTCLIDAGSTAEGDFTTGIGISTNNYGVATNIYYSTIKLRRITASSNVWHIELHTTQSGTQCAHFGYGYLDVGAALTDIAITTSNGTAHLDGGTAIYRWRR